MVHSRIVCSVNVESMRLTSLGASKLIRYHKELSQINYTDIIELSAVINLDSLICRRMDFATKEIILTLMVSNTSFTLPARVYSFFFCDEYMFLKLMKSIKLLDMHGSDIS